MDEEQQANLFFSSIAKLLDSLSIKLAVGAAAADVRRRSAARRGAVPAGAAPRARRGRELRAVLVRWFPRTWQRFVSARRFLRSAQRQLHDADPSQSPAALAVMVSDTPGRGRQAGRRHSPAG